MQRESRRDKMAGCSSRGTCPPPAAQHARLYYLEAITCRCLLLMQLSCMQLTCSLCSSQLKVVHESTLSRGSLKLLISVYNMWVITHTPQQRVSSLLDTFIGISPRYLYITERSLPGVLQRRNPIFGAVTHHFKEPLSLF